MDGRGDVAGAPTPSATPVPSAVADRYTLDEVLEPNTKWEVLLEILEEIRANLATPSAMPAESGGACGAVVRPPIVIVARDDTSAWQLRRILSESAQKCSAPVPPHPPHPLPSFPRQAASASLQPSASARVASA